MRLRFHLPAALTALSALAPLGCEQTYTFAGPVQDYSSDGSLSSATAIQIQNGKATVFFASVPAGGSGPSSPTPVGRWFEGEVDQNNSFSVDDGDWWVQGYLSGDYVSGEVYGPNFSSYFGFELTNADLVGAYEAMDSGCRTGVVVWRNDYTAQPTLQGVWCNEQGQTAPVYAVEPITETDQGIEVLVDLTSLGQASKTLFVTRVSD